MSSSLIGYHCIGPTTISDAQVAAAKKRAEEVIKLAKQWQEAEEKDLDFDIPDFWTDVGIDDLYQVEHIAAMDPSDAHALVEAIADFWNNPHYDDVSWRELSDATKIIFTGGMTWGDEPDGHGYSALKDMFELGVSEELGVF